MSRQSLGNGQIGNWGVNPAKSSSLTFINRSGGYWHVSPYMDNTSTTATLVVENRMHFLPHIAVGKRYINAVAINCVTQAGAGGVMRLGIYAPTTDFQPGELLWQDTVSVTTTGIKQATVPDIEVEGYYIVAAAMQGSATVGNYLTSVLTNYPVSFDNAATWSFAWTGQSAGLGPTNFATASGAFISNPSVTVSLGVLRRITTTAVRYA